MRFHSERSSAARPSGSLFRLRPATRWFKVRTIHKCTTINCGGIATALFLTVPRFIMVDFDTNFEKRGNSFKLASHRPVIRNRKREIRTR